MRMRRRVERVRRGEASGADATLLYQRMLQVLRRQGYQKPVWFTPWSSPARCRQLPQAVPWASSPPPIMRCVSEAARTRRRGCRRYWMSWNGRRRGP